MFFSKSFSFSGRTLMAMQYALTAMAVSLAAPSSSSIFLNKVLMHASLRFLLFLSSANVPHTSPTTKTWLKSPFGWVQWGPMTSPVKDGTNKNSRGIHWASSTSHNIYA